MTQRKSVTVSLPYPGDVISVNHYRGRTRDGREYVKAEARTWMDMLGWQIKSYHIEDWRFPLAVTCSGVFKDERSAPDISNLSKCTLDAIQEVTGIDDKYMRWHDGERKIISTVEPQIIITIEETA